MGRDEGGLLGFGLLSRLGVGESAIEGRSDRARLLTESVRDLASVLTRLERVLQGDLGAIESDEAKALLRALVDRGGDISKDLKELSKALRELAKAKSILQAALGTDGEELLGRGVQSVDALGREVERFCKSTEKQLDKAAKAAEKAKEKAEEKAKG